MLIDVMNDHELEQLMQLPIGETITLALVLTSLPGQFKEIHSPDKLIIMNVIRSDGTVMHKEGHPSNSFF